MPDCLMLQLKTMYVPPTRVSQSTMISRFCIYKGTCCLPNIGFDILVLYRLVVDKNISSFPFWYSMPLTRFNTDKHQKKLPVSLQTSIYLILSTRALKAC